MSAPVIVLDSGAVERVTTDRVVRAMVHDLLTDGWDPVIPTVTLAEAITGRPTDAPANQAINRLGTVTTDADTARRAGWLRTAVVRAGGRRVPSGIDAIVAAHAVGAGRGVVLTTDPVDLRRLLADHPSVAVTRV